MQADAFCCWIAPNTQFSADFRYTKQVTCKLNVKAVKQAL
ncbi:hypothetical protein HMPREF3190_00454 [Umbribacter vaginalis]|nr:hypothetical protein HMPREF3190_00454 [Coriobacteriales bacterium DNF00809]